MSAFDFLNLHYADLTIAFFVVVFVWCLKE